MNCVHTTHGSQLLLHTTHVSTAACTPHMNMSSCLAVLASHTLTSQMAYVMRWRKCAPCAGMAVVE